MALKPFLDYFFTEKANINARVEKVMKKCRRDIG